MAKLPRFTLTHNETKDRWDLTKDGSSRPTATFDKKAEATKGGVLEKAVGKDGGSVKISEGRWQVSGGAHISALCRPEKVTGLVTLEQRRRT